MHRRTFLAGTGAVLLADELTAAGVEAISRAERVRAVRRDAGRRHRPGDLFLGRDRRLARDVVVTRTVVRFLFRCSAGLQACPTRRT